MEFETYARKTYVRKELQWFKLFVLSH